MHNLDDTIVAIASPPGGAPQGIVRLSGWQTVACVRRFFESDGLLEPSSVDRPTSLGGNCHLPGMASPLPCELYLWPGRHSFTGQPVAEIHTIGSPPLLDALVKAACTFGSRLAEPGEFTLRAFLAGRIDLTQAEAVLGAIDAADTTALSTALSQLAGGLATPLGELRDRLLDLLSHLEAGFDFTDEDLSFIAPEELEKQLHEALDMVQRLVRQTASRGTAGETVRVVLLGCPNTGKSSLFNALARHAEPRHDTCAIVSSRPGTTRDYLTVDLDLGGVTCQLIDTAGIVETADDIPKTTETPHSVWQEAQDLAARQHGRAHVRLFCLDTTRPLVAWERDELKTPTTLATLVVLTKCDQPGRTDYHEHAVETSTTQWRGIERLREKIREAVLEVAASGGDVVAGTAVRCHESLRLAAESLRTARHHAENQVGEELVAADVRVALDELGKVAGAVYTDDVLDRIFSRFCIGK